MPVKAAVSTGYGPPEVVRVTEVPIPDLGENAVLVRVHATTVNRTDCGFRSGKPIFARFITGFPRPRHSILGGEFAGVVEAVGGAVSGFAVGERVFGYSEEGLGAHAEYLAIAEDGPIATMPEHADFTSIVPATEASHYAVSLIRAARRCDGHKWLNLPYDSGFAFCAHPEIAAAAMSYSAAYLTGSGTVSGMGDLTAESSRRARGFAA